MPNADTPIPAIQPFEEVVPSLRSSTSVALLKPAGYSLAFLERIQNTFANCFYVPELTITHLAQTIDNDQIEKLALVNFNINDSSTLAIAQKLSDLTVLDLSYNSIGDDGATSIAQNLPKLTALYLGGNNIEGSAAIAITHRLHRLTTLDLSNNAIGPDGARAIANNLQNFTALYLGANSIGTSGAIALARNFNHFASLTTLDLNSNFVGVDGARAIAFELHNLPNLQNLRLNDNDIRDLGARAIGMGMVDSASLTLLDFGSNNIGPQGATSITESLKDLTTLTVLNLGHNNIGPDGATAIAKGLPNLTTLNLNSNGIWPDGATAIAKGLPNLTTLHLNSNNIGNSGATAIANGLPKLATLRLKLNSISPDGAIAISEGLPNLTTLDLGNNSIGADGAIAISEGLPSLTTLDLDSNSVGADGAIAISEGLPNLTTLHLGRNNIGEDGARAIAKGLPNLITLHLEADELSGPLRDALKAGIDSFREVAKVAQEHLEALWEAKILFIGEGEVGKSSLLGALRDEAWNDDRDSTHGLEVTPLPLVYQSQDLRLNAWDFAGQDHYRPTHQIFFTSPAVYLVVWKPRLGLDVSRVEEWLNTIRLRTDATPVCIVVATHGGPNAHAPGLNEEDLRAEFDRQILEFVNIDSKPTPTGIEELKKLIAKAAAELPDMGLAFPAKWNEFRHSLTPSEDSANPTNEPSPYLRYESLEDYAVDSGLTKAAAMALCRIAIVRGQWISCGDAANIKPDDLIVTQPEWLAKAISFVIDDETTRELNGLLQEDRLSEIWANPNRDRQYEPELYPTFLRLMNNFDIAYQVEQTRADLESNGPQWLVAQLIRNQPDAERIRNLPSSETPELHRVIRFIHEKNLTDGPSGLIFQLIVRLHRYSLGADNYRKALHWKDGVVLYHETHGYIEVQSGRERLRLRAWGQRPERLITIIVEEVETLLTDFWPGLEILEFATCGETCPQANPGRGEFNIIKLYEDRNDEIDRVRCQTPGCSAIFSPEILLTGYKPRHNSDLAEIRRDSNATSKALKRIEHAARQIDLTVREGQRPAIDGPVLILPQLVETNLLKKGWVKTTLELHLHCEHSGLPLFELPGNDANCGRVRVELSKKYVKYLSPLISAVTTVVSGLPGGVAPLQDALTNETHKSLIDKLELVEASAEALHAAATVADRAIDLNEEFSPETASGSIGEDLAIREFQKVIRGEDPLFGGVVRRRSADNRMIWVDKQFGDHYETWTAPIKVESF